MPSMMLYNADPSPVLHLLLPVLSCSWMCIQRTSAVSVSIAPARNYRSCLLQKPKPGAVEQVCLVIEADLLGATAEAEEVDVLAAKYRQAFC